MKIKKLAAIFAAFALIVTQSVFSASGASPDADASAVPTGAVSEEFSSVSESDITEAPSEEAFMEPESSPTEAPSEPYATDPISLETVSEPDIVFEWINLYVDSSLAVTKNRPLRINTKIYLPVFEAASLLGLDASSEEKDVYGTTFVLLKYDDKTALVFENSRFAYVNGEKTELDGVSYLIGGVLYTPASAFASVFDISCEEKAPNPDTDFYISSPLTKAQLAYEKTVNSRGVTSRTDYLIWVSKANYSVRLFKKSPSGWRFSAEFPCAIGAPGTPTCEGLYRYYERVAGWYYQTYYVGPVMRFNGGYAIHSTLINYDGTPHDDRVGVKLSHGCVRLHPKDIQYLCDTVPLYTAVYVTAE